MHTFPREDSVGPISTTSGSTSNSETSEQVENLSQSDSSPNLQKLDFDGANGTGSQATNDSGPRTKCFYAYKTSVDRGIAVSMKDLLERFEFAQMCGSTAGEWRSFKNIREAFAWAKEEQPVASGNTAPASTSFSNPSASPATQSVTTQKSTLSMSHSEPLLNRCEVKAKVSCDLTARSVASIPSSTPSSGSASIHTGTRTSPVIGGFTKLYSNDEKWSPTFTGSEANWGAAAASATVSAPTSIANNGKTLFVDADGACPKNGRRGALGGIGVYFGPNDPRNASEPLPGHPQTNQRAELMSLIRAVEILRRQGKSTLPVCLRSDSRYAVSGLTEWVPKWKRNGWTTARGTEVKNQDLWRTLDAEITRLGQLRKVHLVWVKAHAGDRRNEEADKLATEGVRKAEAMRQRMLASLPVIGGSEPQPFKLTPTSARLARPFQPRIGSPSYFSLGDRASNLSENGTAPAGPRHLGIGMGVGVASVTRPKPASASFFAFDQPKAVGQAVGRGVVW